MYANIVFYVSIIDSLKTNSHSKFAASCRSKSLQVLDIYTYVNLHTTIKKAKELYPDVHPVQAYESYVGSFIDYSEVVDSQSTGCGSCGGGKVR